jgi:hypothetical protein
MIVVHTHFFFYLAQLSVFVCAPLLKRFRFILLEWSMVGAHPLDKSEGTSQRIGVRIQEGS